MRMVESETRNKRTVLCGEVKREETRVTGLCYSEDPMIVA